MSDGLKVSRDHIDVTKASVEELIVDSTYAHWKCDLAPTPRHYGQLNVTATVAAFSSETVFSISHGYTYAPSFIVAWSYAAGDSTGSTYGIGDLEILSPFMPIVFVSKTTANTFTITADNTGNSNAVNNLQVQFRFYLFADDFPTYNFVPTL